MSKKSDKRARLIAAADKLFHEQGVNITTLANIAALADVPLGNVYYYFKSKESIVMAVIEARRKILVELFQQWGALAQGKARLKSFIGHVVSGSSETASFGDALGSLCQELSKQGGDIAQAASTLMKEVLAWCEQQFKDLGKGDRAEGLASHLLSSLQGISLLGLTFKDPKYIEKQTDYLVQWLETV